ncbi:MAG: hypothetical protein AAFW00_03580 [Bacteroidota bacterium]
MTTRYLILIWLAISLSACSLFQKVAEIPVDPDAEQSITEGRRLLRSKDYPEALDAFDAAIGEKMHRSTTMALYYAGLAAYYANYDDVAKENFEKLVIGFPESRYVEEAEYHLALIRMHKAREYDKVEGLVKLTEIADISSDPALQDDALVHIQEALFTQFSIEKLKGIEARFPKSWRVYVKEAIIFKLVQEGNLEEAKTQFEVFQKTGNDESEFLTKILGTNEVEDPQTLFEPNIIRLALSLPLYLDETSNLFNREIPGKNRLGLEFMEGFQMAIDEFDTTKGKQLYVELFDSQRDTSQTRLSLDRLDQLVPTLVVGDIYNAQTRILSEWAESRGVPMVVPLSPTPDLVEGKQFTFLGHPSSETHGRRMADYAYDVLGLDRVYVFTDGGGATQNLAIHFADQFILKGGMIDTLNFNSDYELAVKQIPKLVGEITDDSTGSGVYIPVMGNEEAAGLIINVLRQRNKLMPVMGSPHFRSSYNAIPRDIKESYELIFSTSHLQNPEDCNFEALRQSYLQKYGYPPSNFVVQGYDLGKFILGKLETYDPSLGFGLDALLRASVPYESLHIPYYFSGKQSNQSVNIAQYQEGGVRRVN